MKKIITILFCIAMLSIFPVRNSTNAGMKLSTEEQKSLIVRIKKDLITKQINGEYKLFYENLNNNKNYDFVIDFLEKYSREAVESKSLPSVSMAQASLETGFGRFGKLNNNIFGIKGVGIIAKTKEYTNGNLIYINAEFQQFNTIKDAFHKHYQILEKYGVSGNSYENWISKITDCKYATDPLYGAKLKKIIEKYQLYRLDKIQTLHQELNNVEKECNFQPNLTYNIV